MRVLGREIFSRKTGTSSAKSTYIKRLTACAKNMEDSVSAAERRRQEQENNEDFFLIALFNRRFKRSEEIV